MTNDSPHGQAQASNTDAAATRSGYPAGLGRRLGAMFYDGLLILALWFLSSFIWVALTNQVAQGLGFRLMLTLEWFGFYVFFWRNRGQTLGMRAWRLRLIDGSGQRVSLAKAVQRVALAPISLACLGLGYLWLFVDPEKRTWHDRWSQTFVVHIPDD